MMKTFICISILLITFEAFPQKKIDSVRADVCNCFDLIKYNGDKLKFQTEEQNCLMMHLFKGIQSIQSSFPKKTHEELSKILYSELKNKCKSYNEVLTLYFKLSKEKTPTKIIDKSKCSILKNGVFLYPPENTEITMQDSIQTVVFLEYGYYIKSKIKWLDSITYQAIPFEATEPVVKRHLSESLIFNYRIIDIVGDTITFELELNGDYSLGQFFKKK